MKDPNVRPGTIKLLEETIGPNLHNTGFGNDFLAMTLKVQINKRKKIDKLDFMNIFKDSSLASSALAGGFLTTVPLGKPQSNRREL